MQANTQNQTEVITYTFVSWHIFQRSIYTHAHSHEVAIKHSYIWILYLFCMFAVTFSMHPFLLHTQMCTFSLKITDVPPLLMLCRVCDLLFAVCKWSMREQHWGNSRKKIANIKQMDDMVVKIWQTKDYQADTVVLLSRRVLVVLQTCWYFLFHFVISSSVLLTLRTAPAFLQKHQAVHI